MASTIHITSGQRVSVEEDGQGSVAVAIGGQVVLVGEVSEMHTLMAEADRQISHLVVGRRRRRY
ncbi:MAG: hypothetical protein AAGD35_07190 [Actinomycetota bacterium]